MAGIATPYFNGRNEWALILGGSSGIGLATAKKLAQEGMNLFVLHRDRRNQLSKIEAEFEQLKQSRIEVIHLNKDALKPETLNECADLMQEAFGQNGRIKLLLHAVSKGNLKPFIQNRKKKEDPEGGLFGQIKISEDHTLAQIEGTLSEQNLIQTSSSMAFSLLPWTDMLITRKLFSEDARIIGLTSEGNKRFLPAYGAVAVAKSALEAMITQLSVELAPRGIRVNGIQAGVTDTPSLKMIPGSELILANAKYRNPFGRITTSADIANVIYLLCRDESAWINGAIIPVDGGEKNR